MRRNRSLISKPSWKVRCSVHSGMNPCSARFGLILKSTRWSGRTGLILIQLPYMTGLNISLNFREWPSAGMWWTQILTIEQFCSIVRAVKGSEFLKRVMKLAKTKGLPFGVKKERGKGSHLTVYYADRYTILRNPKDELKTGTYHAMLKQLGIDKSEI